VLLNANVAFLGIQSVDHAAPYRSAAQISSYWSTVVSMGSVILGLLLDRQNHIKDRESAQAASAFLSKMTHPSLGLETLAIMYSLPYALLMWGMLSFLIAFCLMCFANATIYTYSIVGSVSLAVCVLIIWSIWTAWESGEHYLLALLKRIYGSFTSMIQMTNDPEIKSKRQWRLPFVHSWDSTATSEKTVQV